MNLPPEPTQPIELDNTPVHADTLQYADTTIAMQPKHLSSRHRAMMRYLISGKPQGEVAELFGMTPSRFSIICNSPLFKAERTQMETEIGGQFVENEGGKVHRDAVREKLMQEALASLDTVIALRDGATSERVRQLSALEILDRAGYKAPERIEGNVEVDASEGLVNAISCAMREMKDGSALQLSRADTHTTTVTVAKPTPSETVAKPSESNGKPE